MFQVSHRVEARDRMNHVPPRSDRRASSRPCLLGAIAATFVLSGCGLSTLYVDEESPPPTPRSQAVEVEAEAELRDTDDLERRHGEFLSNLAGTGAQVSRGADSLAILVSGSRAFRTGSTTVDTRYVPTLAKVAQLLEQDDSRVEIVGHTDAQGSATRNQLLSERRAASVAAYLRENGVAAGRLMSSGMGEQDPVATNETAAGREQNRRVEIIVTPSPGGPS